MKKLMSIIIVFTVMITSCKPKIITPKELTLSEILLLHQWRKTEEAIYNTNNELEEYLFIFEDAKDCEKNSFYIYSVNYNEINFCKDKVLTLDWDIKNDTLFIQPHTYDTISTFYSAKHIEYYDEANYILDYDTIINEENKKIKETYTAFPKN